MYSLVHSGLHLSKKLKGILLHWDIQMEQNTNQLLRQTETAVYQRVQENSAYQWTVTYFPVVCLGVVECLHFKKHWHHENWTSNDLPVSFPTVNDTLCLLNMVHEQETSNKGIDIRRRDMEV